jgi:hypothetical protein
MDESISNNSPEQHNPIFDSIALPEKRRRHRNHRNLREALP